MLIELNIKHSKEIFAIEQKCFSHPLLLENIEQTLINDKYRFIGFILDDKLIGYGSVFIVADESYINNIAVLEDYRNQGIASQIVEKLSDASKECEFVTLEVRESNFPAINLYNKFNFEQVAIRRNYYNKPIENAIIMTKKLGENHENISN